MLTDQKALPPPSQAQSPSGFNPLTHVPPKYDIYGYLKRQKNHGETKYNILAEKDKIKIPWDDVSKSQSTPMTRTKLLERRKLERIPDISYDLDKDGYVGGKDFVLSKRYDLDGDGKLNEEEKKAAYEGIKNGVENNYIWNLDNRIGEKKFRIMQKRGKIIDAEDFSPLTGTYPPHPLSEVVPPHGVKTLSELKDYRLNETKKEINEKIKKWEEKNPPHFVSEQIPVNKTKPLYSSMGEIRDKNHRDARIKVGLAEKENDIKITDKDPTLQYVYNPKHKTYNDVKEEMHQEDIESIKLLNSRKFKNEVERLKEREDEIFARLYNKEPGKTYSQLKAQRQKEIFDYNFKHFAQHAIGVHGQELPKFAESEKMKEFWKFKEGYCENPKFNSQVELLESHKYWKEPEELYLSEHRPYVEPPGIRREKLPEKKDDLIIKVNHVNFYKDFDPTQVRPLDYEKTKKHIYRWSSLVTQFAPSKFRNGRFFDVLPESQSEPEPEQIDFWNNLKHKKTQKHVEEKPQEVDLPIDKPLFSKFSNKDELKLHKSIEVKTKGF